LNANAIAKQFVIKMYSCSVADNDVNVTQYMAVSSSGQITLKRAIIPELTLSNFTVMVTATDDGSCCDSGHPQSTVSSIIVTILGVNQQPTFPDCHSYTATVYENQPANTSVLTVYFSFAS